MIMVNTNGVAAWHIVNVTKTNPVAIHQFSHLPPLMVYKRQLLSHVRPSLSAANDWAGDRVTDLVSTIQHNTILLYCIVLNCND